MLKRPSLIERIERSVAPNWAFNRQRARVALDMLRSYDSASTGRRTAGWKKAATDANSEIRNQNRPIRFAARELVRNNPFAESALSTICDQTVSWGITPSEEVPIWEKWAETRDCDADGLHDFCGLQALVLRTVVESGECFVRRRTRFVSDLKSEKNPQGLSLPVQLQVLEPDYLDTDKNGSGSSGSGRIIQGIEFDGRGRRIGYWMFPEHPGNAETGGAQQSQFVPAESVIHVFRVMRPGQVRGVSWFAPILLRFKDFDDYEDATLMKQKIAACLAVLVTNADGDTSVLGTGDNESPVDYLEPGIIKTVSPGSTIETVAPPRVDDYPSYAKVSLRAIATGIGVTYEDLTGDYENLPFSAARMSRIRHWARVERWRWMMLVPQLIDPVWDWFREAAGVMNITVPEKTDWNAPPLPMIEPDKEGMAIMQNVRAGIQTLRQAVRERGLNYDRFLDELQNDFAQLDKRGLVLDLDPRRMTQQGQAQFDDRFDPKYKSEKTKLAQASAAAEASAASAASTSSKGKD